MPGRRPGFINIQQNVPLIPMAGLRGVGKRPAIGIENRVGVAGQGPIRRGERVRHAYSSSGLC